MDSDKISKEVADTLLVAIKALDCLWGRGLHIPKYVSLAVGGARHLLLKTLQAGGWDLYFNTTTEQSDILMRD